MDIDSYKEVAAKAIMNDIKRRLAGEAVTLSRGQILIEKSEFLEDYYISACWERPTGVFWFDFSRGGTDEEHSITEEEYTNALKEYLREAYTTFNF